MIGELEEIAELEAEEAADRAAFDPGAGFERFAHRQAALGRELLRTVEELRRLRKDSTLAEARGESPGMPHGPASGPCHPEELQLRGLMRTRRVAVVEDRRASRHHRSAKARAPGRRRVRLRPSHAGRTTNLRRIARLETAKTRRTKPNWNPHKGRQERRLHQAKGAMATTNGPNRPSWGSVG